VFWGEWEPPPQVIARWPPNDRLRLALHRPYWYRPAGNGWRQNTDPWAFGERMSYSNCKQTIRPGNRPTALQRLIDDTVDGMHSFIPALPAEGRHPRFARPPVRLPGLINPASTQSAMGANRSRPAQQVRDAWEAIRHEILSTGLNLAVELDTPPRRPADGVDPNPLAVRERC
jgi:hypothetical protein